MRQRITISYATLSLDEKLLLLIKRKACTPFTISLTTVFVGSGLLDSLYSGSNGSFSKYNVREVSAVNNICDDLSA